MADAKYGEILGVHMIGPDVTELLPELTLAQQWDLTAEEVARNVHAHPTLSEALKEVAHALLHNDQLLALGWPAAAHLCETYLSWSRSTRSGRCVLTTSPILKSRPIVKIVHPQVTCVDRSSCSARLHLLAGRQVRTSLVITVETVSREVRTLRAYARFALGEEPEFPFRRWILRRPRFVFLQQCHASATGGSPPHGDDSNLCRESSWIRLATS